MGYDLDRFVGEVNQGLICSICQGILEDPLLAPCEHVYCSRCINAWLTHYNTCPVDRQPLWTTELKAIFRYMQNDLDRMEIKCDKEPDGCTAVVRLDRLAHHLSVECNYVQISCPNQGCTETVIKRDLEAHLLVCDFVAQPCSLGCGLEVRVSEMETHNCVVALRAALDKQRSETEIRFRQLRNEMQSRLDSQRDHMVLKESSLQQEIHEMKSQLARLLQDKERAELERREILAWFRDSKDEQIDKLCSNCKRNVRKESFQNIRAQIIANNRTSTSSPIGWRDMSQSSRHSPGERSSASSPP